jgi:hypothetical protein
MEIGASDVLQHHETTTRQSALFPFSGEEMKYGTNTYHPGTDAAAEIDSAETMIRPRWQMLMTLFPKHKCIGLLNFNAFPSTLDSLVTGNVGVGYGVILQCIERA